MTPNKTITIVCGRATQQEISQHKGPFLGVDYGAYILASLGIHMVAAVGDFDSVNDVQLDLIRQFSSVIEQLSPIKKETDTEVAITYAIQHQYQEITVIGGLGGRLDHSLANMHLLLRHQQYKLRLQDGTNRMQVFPPGVYVLQRDHYRYVSLFAFNDAVFSIQDVRYPVQQKKLRLGDVYAISNEIIDEQASLIIIEGTILVIQSSDSSHEN